MSNHFYGTPQNPYKQQYSAEPYSIRVSLLMHHISCKIQIIKKINIFIFLIFAILFVISYVTNVQSQGFSNPFKLKVEWIDIYLNTVRVKIWSDTDISSFPSTQSPVTPWADSLWLIYKTNSYPINTIGANVVLFSTEKIKQASPDTLIDTIKVDNPQIPNDTTWWFSYTVKWRIPGNPDTLIKPFINTTKLFCADTGLPPNHFAVRGEYLMKTDTALIIVDSISKMKPYADLYNFVVIQCSKSPGFNSYILNDTIQFLDLIACGESDTIIIDSVGIFPIETDTIYCQWYLVFKNGAVGITQHTIFTIGWDRPVYQGLLTADSTYMPDRIHVSWDAPQAGTDTVRVWWDTCPIPFIYNPNLTLDHSFYPKYGFTTDTITGLINNTTYYFGLQIFKDNMWSKITAKSSDTAKTAYPISINQYTVNSVPFNKQPIKIVQKSLKQGLSINIFFASLENNISISISSLNGKTIFAQQYNYSKSIVLKPLLAAKGIYFLRFSKDNMSVTRKIIFAH